ncbi:EmrB/QacA subfamily drug resistance transporter [Actinoplanes tereljensis]|uniref:MFS transporter n=1 Tax=Paractinoplanes tereljensis TaxID=571912 RepID=A0A919TS01_9ACTN|nr:MFS transporter [Actinoplanes tereljensis]GIF19986.1 MFS transporter [Actinoplanes tereljensis]
MTEAATTTRQRRLSLAAICAAAGLVWLAFADLGVAIPAMAGDLHADLSALQWANNAFSLVTGALVIAAGKFGDIFGRRRMLGLGIVLFAGFSVLCALAPNVSTLIAGRALMGVGAALILPATLALIPSEFTGPAELTAFGIWQAVAWGGQAVGPAIGGVLTDGLGWRWLFWINLPLAAITLVALRASTPESRDEQASRRIDWPGLVTIGLAIFALLFALTDGPAAGWGDPLIVGLLAAAVLLAIAWYAVEKHAEEPLVKLAMFKLRSYDAALTANLVMNLAFAGLSYLLVLWLQNVRGYDAVEAGLLMLPSTLGIFVFIPRGARLESRRGGRMPVLLGLAVLAAGLAVLGFLHPDASLWVMAASLLIVGVGLGLLSTPISNTAVGAVPADLAGAAAGVFKMSSMVGGALGIAVLSAVTRGLAAGESTGAMRDAGLNQSQIDAATNALVGSSSFEAAIASLPPDVGRAVTTAAANAFTGGIAGALLVSAAIAVVAMAIVRFVWPGQQ